MSLTTKIKNFMGLPFIDTIYKFLTFHDFFIAAFPFIQKIKVRKIRKQQQLCIQECAKKSQITVLFFLQNESIWKYDTLYQLLDQSDRYKPIIVISPFNVHLNYDKTECLNVMKKAVAFAQKQNYNYLCAYDFEKNKWLDVKKIFNPDIVIFSKPYKDTLPNYHIYKFEDKLTMHAPYGICCVDIFRINYNLPFNNLLWKLLVETEYQKGFAEKYSLCKGDNATIVGALATERLIDKKYVPIDVWKPQSKQKKRIIWAPHHTIDNLFNFSNFLVYCDYMLELAKKYEEEVQFTFKPHPILKFKLINLWGKEKTEEYYKKWEELENSQIEQGYYIDLFLTSDALIHDCASFTAEYLFTKKPTLFMVKDPQVLSHMNPFGRKCFDMHYHAHNEAEIENFINDVVLAGNDSMKPQREEFFNEYLYPKDGIMPSQKIVNILKEELGK